MQDRNFGTGLPVVEICDGNNSVSCFPKDYAKELMR